MGGCTVRSRLLAVLLLLFAPASASAEWQLKPFFGLTFGGSTTLISLDGADDNVHVAIGASVLRLGEIFGVEADFGRVPGFFQSGVLVLGSSVTTLTGNIVVALPRRMAEYGLRPYFVGGGGLIRARSEDLFDALSFTENLAAFDLGGGATGFVTDRLGLSWEVRYFRGARGSAERTANSIGAAQLSFWRAGMAVAIRY